MASPFASCADLLFILFKVINIFGSFLFLIITRVAPDRVPVVDLILPEEWAPTKDFLNYTDQIFQCPIIFIFFVPAFNSILSFTRMFFEQLSHDVVGQLWLERFRSVSFTARKT
jgi:hypothetical protein